MSTRREDSAVGRLLEAVGSSPVPGLLDFHSVGILQAYLPVALFALLFGLSMDYEVFLVRRMHV
jgi:uncharacterized membrane protein YdfJ with MMPL/SSD domain